GWTDIAIEIPPIEHPGRYALKFDLVSEGVDWFEHCGSPTTTRKLWVSRLFLSPRRPQRAHSPIVHPAREMKDAVIDRIHDGGRRRPEMANAQRMAVLMERHRLDIDSRQGNVDAPGIARSIASGIPEGVVVVRLGQSRVQPLITVDVGGHSG